MTDFTLQQLALRLCAMLLILGLHGAAVAGAACALGDAGPRYDRRLSLSPLAHIDLLGLASGVLFSVGWIKPIAVDPNELRLGRIGLVIIVVAALAAVLVSVLAFQLVRPMLLPHLGDTSATLAFALIETFGRLGIWFVLINSLPLPPLTGAHLLTALVPQSRSVMGRAHTFAALLLTALAATGLVTSVLGPAQHTIARLVLGE